MTDEIDYEKISYGKSTYKRVQRLRRKGQKRGIEVPHLGYELSKPEKPRIAFWIIAIISAVLLVGVLVGLGFLINELIKLTSLFEGSADVIKAVFDPATFMLSAGLSTLPALLIILAYFMLFLIFLLPIIAAIYMYRFVREVFYMAKCSKEEFAKGNIIASRIFRLCTLLAIATVILIVLMIYMPEARLITGLIYGGIVIVLGSFLTLTVMEKVKCGKWFETLEEDKKQNFLAHDGGLRQVKRRLNTEKNYWSNFGR